MRATACGPAARAVGGAAVPTRAFLPTAAAAMTVAAAAPLSRRRARRRPERFSDTDVAEQAAARGLALNPGRASYPGEPAGPYLRLSYSAAEPPALVTAVQILAEILGQK